MKVNIESHDFATVVKVQGKIDIGEGDIQLRECLYQVAEDEKKIIILDLEKVKYVDSSGVGELVAANSYLQAQGINLCLTHVHPKIYGLLDLTRLVTVFNIYDSNEDALQLLARAA